jgi:hypothetical protein
VETNPYVPILRRVIAAALAAIFVTVCGAARAAAAQEKPASATAIPRNALRERALKVEARQIGLSPSSGQVWGTIVDMTVENGTATVVCFLDGTTSLYTSTGGGLIGAGGHESVRKTTTAFLKLVNAHVGGLPVATDFTLPQEGRVEFFIRRDANVLVAEASLQELSSEKHPLFKVFHSLQAVINEMQRTSK